MHEKMNSDVYQAAMKASKVFNMDPVNALLILWKEYLHNGELPKIPEPEVESIVKMLVDGGMPEDKARAKAEVDLAKQKMVQKYMEEYGMSQPDAEAFANYYSGTEPETIEHLTSEEVKVAYQTFGIVKGY
jgi:hypothetical protein